jgi:hypothetical protein
VSEAAVGGELGAESGTTGSPPEPPPAETPLRAPRAKGVVMLGAGVMVAAPSRSYGGSVRRPASMVCEEGRKEGKEGNGCKG